MRARGSFTHEDLEPAVAEVLNDQALDLVSIALDPPVVHSGKFCAWKPCMLETLHAAHSSSSSMDLLVVPVLPAAAACALQLALLRRLCSPAAMLPELAPECQVWMFLVQVFTCA